MQDVSEVRPGEARLVASRVDVRLRPDGFVARLGDINIRCDPDGGDPAVVADRVHIVSPLSGRIVSGDVERTRVAVSPERSALAIAWPAGRRTVRLDVSAAIETVEVDGGRASMRVAGGGGVFVASDTCVRYVVDHGPHGVSLEVSSESAGCLCIVAASDPPGGGDAALLRSPELLERITMAWLGRRAAEAPGIITADPQVDGLWEWCTRRVALPDHRAPAFADAGLLALGALAAGAPHVADRLVRSSLDSLRDANGFDSRSIELVVVAAGRTVAWTGDASLAAGYWPDVEDAMMRLPTAAGDSRDGDAISLRAAAARESAVIADAAGARPRAAQLAAESLHLSRLASAHVVRGPWTHALRVIGNGAADPNASGSEEGTARDLALATWASLAAAHESARPRLRLLADAVRGGSDVVAAALAACAILDGLLGVDPDAARGRIALRPLIAIDLLPFFDLYGVRTGDAEFRVRTDRASSLVRFTLEQTSGPVPFQLVFEPRLCVARVRACKVDGEPADLDVRRAGSHWVAPVQLTLDAPRLVEIEIDS
jgi:hypothetical protein